MKERKFLKKRSYKDINLLRAYQYETRKREKMLRIFVAILILEVVLFCIISFGYITKIKIIKNEIKTLELLKSEKQKDTLVIKNAAAEVKLLKLKEKFVNLKLEEHKNVLKILNELEKITPQDVVFDSLSFSKGEINCVVRSNSVESLFKFVVGIRTSSVFTNVSFSNIRSEGDWKLISVKAKIQ
ncbi:Fimbrial assembly family protein [Caldicellulosiruptor hydrothermalis 108]|uniref:Fimbrial assembly family protein n=1 Tax=Caldicellulosiruptor hydrothermalis (strain DSM 18901 / VKM B-2411 / 108) TaxID=632292 RepID=E4Q7C1_CALH1|nr:Fimbrial assembly family protein [Caldicellulosiruptor hydrothermalis 108]